MGSKFEKSMISWLPASCFEHKMGSHGDESSLLRIMIAI